MKYISKSVLILFLIPLMSFANNDKKKHEKKRIIQKQYNVNKDATVRLNNRYGNLTLTTWDENRVEIEVEIIVKGNDLEQVELKLSTIDVVFKASNSLVDAETIFEKNKSNWSWWSGNNNLNYEINYRVKLPVTNHVDLNNDYGNIYLDVLEGKASINCDYGKISIGELKNTSNTINLDYCSGSTVSYIENGSVNIDYSKLTIDDAKNIRLNMDYSTTVFKNIETLNFNADYGGVRVEEGVRIFGNGDYTSMRFGTIHKTLKIDTDYGSVRVNNLLNGFETVDITAEYAGIKIGTSNTNNFNFEIDLMYAGFKRDQNNVDLRKSIVKSSKKYYEGVFGKGNADSNITIKSQYGSVTFQNNKE